MAWRKLLKQSFVVDKVLKDAVKEYWQKVRGTRVHARRFVLSPGDAQDENMFSTDVSPQGIGVVDHYTGHSWGAEFKPEDCALITRHPWGSVSSSSFETAGVCTLTLVAPGLRHRHEGKFPLIVCVYGDNKGTETIIDPSNPKFKRDCMGPQIWLTEQCEKKNIVIVTDRLDTKTIPADVPSRMYKGEEECERDLNRRRILSVLTSMSRRAGFDSPLLGFKDMGKTGTYLLNYIGSYLRRPRSAPLTSLGCLCFGSRDRISDKEDSGQKD